MKSLIVYYSRRGENLVNGEIQTLQIGNTEMAAMILQKITGAEIFRILPRKDYPEEYCLCIDLARQDLLRGKRPKLKVYPEQMDSYSRIYLGYPNYWGTMPAPVFSFLEHYDFTGKEICPFCTYEDTGFGHSLEDLKKVCKAAVIQEGFSVRGMEVANETEAIGRWVKGILKI